jgi:hypothetical protein
MFCLLDSLRVRFDNALASYTGIRAERTMATDNKNLLTVYLDRLTSVLEGQAVAKAIMLAGVGLLFVSFVFAPEKRTGLLFWAGVVLLTLGPGIIVVAVARRHTSQREARRYADRELFSVFEVSTFHPDQWAATLYMADEGCHMEVKGIVRYRRRAEGTEGHREAHDLGKFFGLVKHYVEHRNAEFECMPTCAARLVETETGSPRRHVLVDLSFRTDPPRARVSVGFDMPPLKRLPLHLQLAKSVPSIPGVSGPPGASAAFP